MKSNEKLENEKIKKFHYLLVSKDFDKVRSKLDKALNYHRLELAGKFDGMEVIYDVPSNLLSKAGIVLSKQYEGEKSFFKVRKISQLPGGYKRPSQKFNLGESQDAEAPKDFPMQIANAISNLFANVFTIDLVSVVRQTEPKIEIIVDGYKYNIIGGTGYRAVLLYENAIYKDVKTNKKVKRIGVTLKMPNEEKYEKENQTILSAIEHSCKELVGYEQSRFEIAERLLYPKPIGDEKKQKDEE